MKDSLRIEKFIHLQKEEIVHQILSDEELLELGDKNKIENNEINPLRNIAIMIY